tara:strand:+ start:1093 stop:1335 length:243 start_codon:yes stop_codon:yes gene_type:complete
MRDRVFDYWQRLELQVGDEIGHDIQIDTSSSLADNFIEDCEDKGFGAAVYDMKWLLVYHYQSVGNSISKLIEDYPEIEII